MAPTLRAWTVPDCVSFGDLSRLALTGAAPATKEDTSQQLVTVATKAVGLNFADVFTLLGYYKAANEVRTKNMHAFCPGLEFSGVVVDVAEGITEFQKGDRVYGFTRFGAYADQVQVVPDTLQKLPSNWSFEQGAAFLVNALTAWHGLVTVAGMPLVESKSSLSPYVVVVHSAAGGVGLWASEIAARRGAVVVGIVGQHEKKRQAFLDRIQHICPAAQCMVRPKSPNEFASALRRVIIKARAEAGQEPASDSCVVPETSQSLVEQGWGADIVMECYGGPYFQPSLDVLNAGGSLATYGSTTYNGSSANKNRLAFLPLVWKYLTRPRIDPGELTGRNVRVGGFNLIFLTERTDALRQALQDCIACLTNEEEEEVGSPLVQGLNSVTPPTIGAEFDFTKAIDALQALRSGATVGKVVLVNRDNPLLSTNDMCATGR